jgi:hypothetical protein
VLQKSPRGKPPAVDSCLFKQSTFLLHLGRLSVGRCSVTFFPQRKAGRQAGGPLLEEPYVASPAGLEMGGGGGEQAGLCRGSACVRASHCHQPVPQTCPLQMSFADHAGEKPGCARPAHPCASPAVASRIKTVLIHLEQVSRAGGRGRLPGRCVPEPLQTVHCVQPNLGESQCTWLGTVIREQTLFV